MYQQDPEERRNNMFAWFQAIANTTEPIFSNIAMAGIHDKNQRELSENASRKMIIMNICQALGVLGWDFYDKKSDLDNLRINNKEDYDRIMQKGKMYFNDEFERMSLPKLYYIQSVVQKEAGLGATSVEKMHSVFNEFEAYKRNRGF